MGDDCKHEWIVGDDSDLPRIVCRTCGCSVYLTLETLRIVLITRDQLRADLACQTQLLANAQDAIREVSAEAAKAEREVDVWERFYVTARNLDPSLERLLERERADKALEEAASNA
jgi:hypothetical protein